MRTSIVTNFANRPPSAAHGFTAAILLLVLAGCSDRPAEHPESRTVSVTGVGEAQAPPDQAQISAGVQSFGETVVAASRDNEAILSRIMRALEAEGIEERDIGTTNYSIWAEQNYNQPDAPQIKGYHVSNVVNVSIKDIARTGEVLAAVTNAGANSVHGIQFGVSDTAELESTARERAIADARRRAESLTRLAGVELGHVISISTGSGPGPVPLMRANRMEVSDMTAPTPTITPGQQSVSVQIHVTYAIR
jgi:hypothetical protein